VELPKNERADRIWRSIIKSTSVKDKHVLDLGCGYGDFIVRAYHAGAKSVTGWDKDPDACGVARQKTMNLKTVRITCYDAESWEPRASQFDLALCLSVLPYVDMKEMLRKLKLGSHTTIIECQYAGDGPGPTHITDDADMARLLKRSGFKASLIGWTKVKDKRYKRSIWRCV
jgi:SAM-dependent methyltransferase